MDKSYLDTITATNLCTLKEYIYVYPRLMKDYLKLGEDCSEMYFIEEQIEQHLLHIENNKNTQKKILDHASINKFGTFEDWVKTVRSYDIRIVSLKAIINFLETKKLELEKPHQKVSTNQREKMKVIALLYWYNGELITRENADLIAEKYDYFAKNSGEGLYQDYICYSNNTDRLSSGETKRKCSYKIKLFKRTIELLTNENAKAKAITELNLLENKLPNCY